MLHRDQMLMQQHSSRLYRHLNGIASKRTSKQVTMIDRTSDELSNDADCCRSATGSHCRVPSRPWLSATTLISAPALRNSSSIPGSMAYHGPSPNLANARFLSAWSLAFIDFSFTFSTIYKFISACAIIAVFATVCYLAEDEQKASSSLAKLTMVILTRTQQDAQRKNVRTDAPFVDSPIRLIPVKRSKVYRFVRANSPRYVLSHAT